MKENNSSWITRVCPYDSTEVDVADCWQCKYMLTSGCILDKKED